MCKIIKLMNERNIFTCVYNGIGSINRAIRKSLYKIRSF